MNNPSSLSHVEAAAMVKAWANRCGHIDADTLRLPLGLTAAEWKAASFFDRVIPQVALPPELEEQVGWYQSGYYRSNFQLTEPEKAGINELTILTKQDACLRLGISPRTFDRWKKLTQTKHVVHRQIGNNPVVYGYRQSDIDEMVVMVKAHRK